MNLYFKLPHRTYQMGVQNATIVPYSIVAGKLPPSVYLEVCSSETHSIPPFIAGEMAIGWGYDKVLGTGILKKKVFSDSNTVYTWLFYPEDGVLDLEERLSGLQQEYVSSSNTGTESASSTNETYASLDFWKEWDKHTSIWQSLNEFNPIKKPAAPAEPIPPEPPPRKDKPDRFQCLDLD